MALLWPPELFKVDTPIASFQLSPYESRYLPEILAVDPSPPRHFAWGDHFAGRYDGFTLTMNGRSALALALEAIAPGPNDEIMIVTTTGSPYISSCVTREIEKLCKWSRQRSSLTRAVLAIHEFGFPVDLPAALTAGLPVIEDCAWICGSAGPDDPVGQQGDYVIYSFPKTWPMPFGGLLKSRAAVAAGPDQRRISDEATRVLMRGLATHLPQRAAIKQVRRQNYALYTRLFEASGFPPYFELAPEVIPHTFVFRLEDEARAKRAKGYMMAAGIESTVFFGAGGYYLPNHQNMSAASIEYLHHRFLDAWERAA